MRRRVDADLIPPAVSSSRADEREPEVSAAMDPQSIEVRALARRFKRNKAALREWLEETLLTTMILEARDAQVPGPKGSAARGRVFDIANATLAAMDRSGVEGAKRRPRKGGAGAKGE